MVMGSLDMTHGSRAYARMLFAGQVVNHYQPIVNLQTGKVVGAEILARLSDGKSPVILPAAFLPTFEIQALDKLLFTSLPMGLAILERASRTHPDIYVSFNVSPRVMASSDFASRFLRALSAHKTDPGRIVLEILEDDEFLSLPEARACLEDLHGEGIRIALDDVGSGYSSLNRLRELRVVDKIKLDQAFVRGMAAEPEGMHFVSAMMSLARGLHEGLIVEGVETPEIMQALSVIGVEDAQGYAIARPMPAGALAEWLAGSVPKPVEREPTSLLGAYAAHLAIVEAFRALANQPLKFHWDKTLHDPHACSIGRFFDANGLHESDYGEAHKRFHAVMDQYSTNPVVWEKAASDLWRGLQRAIKNEAALKASGLAPDARTSPCCDQVVRHMLICETV